MHPRKPVVGTFQVCSLFKNTWERAIRLFQDGTLTTLNLDANSGEPRDALGDVGAAIFAKALRVHGSLQELSLNDNDISDIGAPALADANHNTGGAMYTREWCLRNRRYEMRRQRFRIRRLRNR